MKSTDLRAKARAIFGSAIAEPMPKQPNGAKALQQRANARPIPTYKVGGVVKSTPPGPTAAERAEARRQNESLKKAKVTPKEGKVIGSANRSEGSMYKKGGAAKSGLAVMIAIGKPMKGMKKPVKKALGGLGKFPSATGKGLSSAPSQGYYSGLTGREQHGIKRAEKTVAPRMGAPVKKALGGKIDAKLSQAITGAKADMARMAARPTVNPANMPAGRGGTMNKVMNNPVMRGKLEAAAAKAADLSAAAGSMPARGGGMMNKVMNNPKMRAKLEAAAAKAGVPVKRAVGGVARMDPTNVRTLTRGGLGKSMGVFAGRSVAPERMGAPVKRAVGGAGKTRKGMCK